MRQISSIVPSLRTQKPASRWCSPKHCYKNLLRCIHLPWCLKLRPLSPPKTAHVMVLMLSEQILLNGTGNGSISHDSWVVGYLGHHGNGSERWVVISMKPCPVSHPMGPVESGWVWRIFTSPKNIFQVDYGKLRQGSPTQGSGRRKQSLVVTPNSQSFLQIP